MPTPLGEMLPQIVTLNVPTEPFSYYAEGNRIIGWWDIVKATSIGIGGLERVDESYRLNVTLDEASGTFDYSDVSASTDIDAGFTGDGFQIGMTKEWSWGKSSRKEWHYEFGGFNRARVGNNGEQQAGFQPLVYSFETSRIKEPLFAWLQSHGWQHKGLMGRLFAH